MTLAMTAKNALISYHGLRIDIPFELVELAQHLTRIALASLALDIAIVAFMFYRVRHSEAEHS